MSDMEKIFNFFAISNGLKSVERWGDTPQVKEKESSADHSWQLMVMVYILNQGLKLNLDLEKALKIALFHDLPEAICGDIDNSLIYNGVISKEEKEANESQALHSIVAELPDGLKKDILNIVDDYENGISEEARIVKALDKIESIEHLYLSGKDSFDIPDLIGTHCNKAVKNAPKIKPVLVELQNRLKPVYAELGWEWKDEYSDY